MEMDFLVWYGVFWSMFGCLVGCVATWLVFKEWRRQAKPQTPYQYNVHDEVDLIVDAIEL